MNQVKIALYHCPITFEYKLVKVTSTIDEDDPCLMWVFDSKKMNLAKKIMKNLNIAHLLASHTNAPILA